MNPVVLYLSLLISHALLANSSKLRKAMEFDLVKCYPNSVRHLEFKLAHPAYEQLSYLVEIRRHTQYALKGSAVTAHKSFIYPTAH